MHVLMRLRKSRGNGGSASQSVPAGKARPNRSPAALVGTSSQRRQTAADEQPILQPPAARRSTTPTKTPTATTSSSASSSTSTTASSAPSSGAPRASTCSHASSGASSVGSCMPPGQGGRGGCSSSQTSEDLGAALRRSSSSKSCGPLPGSRAPRRPEEPRKAVAAAALEERQSRRGNPPSPQDHAQEALQAVKEAKRKVQRLSVLTSSPWQRSATVSRGTPLGREGTPGSPRSPRLSPRQLSPRGAPGSRSKERRRLAELQASPAEEEEEEDEAEEEAFERWQLQLRLKEEVAAERVQKWIRVFLAKQKAEARRAGSANLARALEADEVELTLLSRRSSLRDGLEITTGEGGRPLKERKGDKAFAKAAQEKAAEADAIAAGGLSKGEGWPQRAFLDCVTLEELPQRLPSQCRLEVPASAPIGRSLSTSSQATASWTSAVSPQCYSVPLEAGLRSRSWLASSPTAWLPTGGRLRRQSGSRRPSQEGRTALLDTE
eukprot:TRINITY_DN80575_c0_g1_i1.p1 TRINITY_DN80575_c0_g1~~TRINITY_DN80575_c0_g1_i1.p1  ORF type:complete len:494 (+),score=94.70 TRINITY_DN80575_c0_g1_i1:155-1636(+)